ncbi:hypothetical protein [Cystobacter ferrugineus]|uniref:Uncharacterized protein n=1 Tax=Cystobacter ferrugineus TaxID=83449 RepID=A0A1L9B7G6_9BACT|nr:hypothetical protein [Cystobacter ferrugineus]OJH38180.1 hypothetical protein BON30_23815 [Cystobacter ferrugineus]
MGRDEDARRLFGKLVRLCDDVVLEKALAGHERALELLTIDYRVGKIDLRTLLQQNLLTSWLRRRRSLVLDEVSPSLPGPRRAACPWHL